MVCRAIRKEDVEKLIDKYTKQGQEAYNYYPNKNNMGEVKSFEWNMCNDIVGELKALLKGE